MKIGLKLKPFGILASIDILVSVRKLFKEMSMSFSDFYRVNSFQYRSPPTKHGRNYNTIDIYPLQFDTVEKLHNRRLLKLQLAIYYIADSRGVIGKNVTTTTSHIGENFINKLLPFGRNGLVCLAHVQN